MVSSRLNLEVDHRLVFCLVFNSFAVQLDTQLLDLRLTLKLNLSTSTRLTELFSLT
jgi:hypothetical protein